MSKEFEELRKELRYDPETGKLTWLSRRPGRKDPSKTKPSNGYYKVTVNGKGYHHHVLAFILQGQLPPWQIDHKNGNRLDNRWCNLRAATSSENNANKPGKASSGHKNIRKQGHHYAVELKHNYTPYRYWAKTLEKAISWRDSKLKELHGEFANTGHINDNPLDNRWSRAETFQSLKGL